MQTLTQGSSRKGTRVTRSRVQLHDDPKCQALVVRKVDNTIHWINHYSADGAVFVLSTVYRWIAIYSVDSVVQPSNSRGQVDFHI